jgi:hypothetical protein
MVYLASGGGGGEGVPRRSPLRNAGPKDRQDDDQQHGKDRSAADAIHSKTSYSNGAAAVHGIMTMIGRYALTASAYANVYVKIWRHFGAGLSEELTMTKGILAITILALTTSGALAAHHRHHHQAMNESPAVGAPSPIGAPSPVIGRVL